MFLELFTYTALIQFMGAFNFAYVFDKFREKLIKYVFNIDKVFADEFTEINSKIATLNVSIPSLKKIGTEKGCTNFDSIQELKTKFDNLKRAIKDSEEKLKEEYYYQDIPVFIEEIFLVCGLYCIADLFFIAHIANTYGDFHVCFWFGIFTALTFAQLTYYSISNFFYKVKDVMQCKWFSKGLDKAAILSITLFFISGLFCFLNERVFCNHVQLKVHQLFFTIISFVALILPFAGFIICYGFIKRADNQSRGKIKSIADSRKKELDKLNKEADDIDRGYRTFSSPKFGGRHIIVTPKFNGGNQAPNQSAKANKTPKRQNTAVTTNSNKESSSNPPKQGRNQTNNSNSGRRNGRPKSPTRQSESA